MTGYTNPERKELMFRDSGSEMMMPRVSRIEPQTTPRKAGNVRDQLGRLAAIEKGLGEAVERLEVAVNPVIYSGPEASANGDCARRESSGCDLSQEIGARCDGLEMLLARLERLVNRVDL